MLVSLTVGKVDAGVAVLLTEDNRLIEFPSVLLPRNITSGSIVNINVSRNFAAEEASVAAFNRLQDNILTKYGLNSPSPPVLHLRNATQTSIVLCWDPINLATASIRSLALYRNDSKAGNIPRPFEVQSTKISGLAIDTEYTFHLVLRTSAGTYSSQKLKCRTHKMTDLSGITVTPGNMPAAVRVSLGQALERIGGKLVDNVRIDTTHFVCTEAGGEKWEKAVKQNIPVVRPEWVDGCEREGTIVSVRGYYLDADPKLRQIGPNVRRHSSLATAAATTTTTMTTTTTRTDPSMPLTPSHDGSTGPESISNTSVKQNGDSNRQSPVIDRPAEEKRGDSRLSTSTTKANDSDEAHLHQQQTCPTAENRTDPATRSATSDGPVSDAGNNKEESLDAEDKSEVKEPVPPTPPPKNTEVLSPQNGVDRQFHGSVEDRKHSLPIRGKDQREQTGSEGENLEEVPL
ncbi:Chitin synthase, class 5 [Ascosphaera aggregata]|nr:Chitin synthase, class 5 [Ascosphaera aggregata]